ncbi:hypothetical protein WA026_019594 [Henosepilachna vigintioctopunctata]|uniref:Uncharacterized protein n=1 Tax=Henosepilachna vigintioctopunctata TaxID=420089 RepID=A0AAW1TY74_9CUCU
MADGDGGAVNRLCKYCRKSVVVSNPKNAKCVNCESLLHPSCALRMKTLIIVDEQENLVKCCEKETPNKSEIICDFSTMEVLKVEISYLKMLLEEKNSRINELIKINELLEYKITQKTFENSSAGNSNISDKKNKIQHVETKKSYTDVVKQTKEGSSYRNEHVGTTKFKNTEELINEQKRIMNEVINLEIDRPDASQEGTVNSWNVKEGRNKHRRNINEELRIYNNPKENRTNETSNTQDGFSETTRKNRKQLPKTKTKTNQYETRGCASVSTGDSFRAKPSKMWLYVGRAMTSVTESIVKDFIVSKCKITEVEDVDVKKLSLLGNSSAFQVGIAPAYFEEINRAEFWPQGIIIRRFHFDFKKNNTTGKNHFLYNTPQSTAQATAKLE